MVTHEVAEVVQHQQGAHSLDLKYVPGVGHLRSVNPIAAQNVGHSDVAPKATAIRKPQGNTHTGAFPFTVAVAHGQWQQVGVDRDLARAHSRQVLKPVLARRHDLGIEV